MTMSAPRIDNTIQLGQLLNGGVLLVILGLIASLIGWKSDVDAAMKQIPKIETIEASDKLQDERITNINRSLDSISDNLARTSDALGKISTSIAVIEERTKKKDDATNR